MDRAKLLETVQTSVASAPVWDFHTHLYPPAFGTNHGRDVEADPTGLMLWGIDELLTYHYLVAECFRATSAGAASIQKFWELTKAEQADLIWKELFVNRAPLSEACRGVLTTLSKLGLDPNAASLDSYRQWFSEQSPAEQIDRVLKIAGVERVTMTNDVFDDYERQRWQNPTELTSDSRFPAVLRFDALVTDWPAAAKKLTAMGYQVDDQLSESAVGEVQRFLEDWVQRMQPLYCAMSLPPSWRYPSSDVSSPAEVAGERCLSKAILPVCEQYGLPLALMIGVNRQTNPALRDAGDSVGMSDITSLNNLCRAFTSQRILCTMLARENQHELAVAARKFPNLIPFGCWWFLNNPSLIEEITRMRLELLGPTFIPQHSDCRILEQLIYKWGHSRAIIAKVLADKFYDLQAAGLSVTPEMINSEVENLLYNNIANVLNQS